MNLRGKKVTIIGLMRSGQACARLVLRAGGFVRISDQKNSEGLDVTFINWLQANYIECEFNGHTKEFIEDSDFVVISPGVRRDAEVLRWAKDKDIAVISEIEFAYQFCQKPVIAITGSNGKTTVSTLISKVIDASGQKSCLCGNVGRPFSDYVLGNDPIDCYVLELSSFQLEALVDAPCCDNFKLFKPYIAVLLNFTQNHLDRHKDMDEYFEAKCRIFSNQDKEDVAIINESDTDCVHAIKKIKASVALFNPLDEKSDDHNSNANTIVVERVAECLGIGSEICHEVFDSFTGVEHRCEFVRSYCGVDYVNDSKSTTAEATIWALTQAKAPVMLLCGGKDKNIDFGVTVPLVKDKVKKIFVFGQAMEKMVNIFNGHIELEECLSLKDAIEKAKDQAQKGSCILLSPMCASYDSFKNFEERGQVFKDLVHQWKD